MDTESGRSLRLTYAGRDSNLRRELDNTIIEQRNGVFTRESLETYTQILSGLDPTDLASPQKIPLPLIEIISQVKFLVNPPPKRPDAVSADITIHDIRHGLALLNNIWDRIPQVPNTAQLIKLIQFMRSKEFNSNLRYNYNSENDSYELAPPTEEDIVARKLPINQLFHWATSTLINSEFDPVTIKIGISSLEGKTRAQTIQALDGNVSKKRFRKGLETCRVLVEQHLLSNLDLHQFNDLHLSDIHTVYAYCNAAKRGQLTAIKLFNHWYSHQHFVDEYDQRLTVNKEGLPDDLIYLRTLGKKGEDFMRRNYPNLIVNIDGIPCITKANAAKYTDVYNQYVQLIQEGYEPIAMYAPDLQNPHDDQLRQRLSRAIRQKKIDGKKLFDMWLGKTSDIQQFLDLERQQQEQREILKREGFSPITAYAPSLSTVEGRKRRSSINRAARKGLFPSVKALDGTIWGPTKDLDQFYGEE